MGIPNVTRNIFMEKKYFQIILKISHCDSPFYIYFWLSHSRTNKDLREVVDKGCINYQRTTKVTAAAITLENSEKTESGKIEYGKTKYGNTMFKKTEPKYIDEDQA